MHKRLFRKYFSVFAILLTITIAALGMVSSAIIGINSFNEQSTSMERAAIKISNLVSELPKNYHIIAGNLFESSVNTVQETIESVFRKCFPE